jgi:Lon protease-like protein
MLRRCLESSSHRFGMVMPPRNGGGASEYGTMLEIRSVRVLPDGRSMVETWGTHRFRIAERGTLDGYMVARVERIDDVPAHDMPPEPEVPTVVPRLRVKAPGDEELMRTCKAFLEQLRAGTAPWVVQRLNNTYGPMPTDAASFSFWMALVSLGLLWYTSDGD